GNDLAQHVRVVDGYERAVGGFTHADALGEKAESVRRAVALHDVEPYRHVELEQRRALQARAAAARDDPARLRQARHIGVVIDAGLPGGEAQRGRHLHGQAPNFRILPRGLHDAVDQAALAGRERTRGFRVAAQRAEFANGLPVPAEKDVALLFRVAADDFLDGGRGWQGDDGRFGRDDDAPLRLRVH